MKKATRMVTSTKIYTHEEGIKALKRAGMSATIEPWEDGLREQPRPGSLEWWYFDAQLNDGSTLVLVFETKRASDSANDLTPHMETQLTLPTGEVVNVLQSFSAGYFHASRDGCNVHIGPNWVQGNLRRYELSTQSPELSLHLTFSGTVPAARIGTGKTLIGSPLDYLGWLVAIPRGMVEGTITLRGQTRTVSGEGYHDHNWGTIPFEDYLHEWYWGRAYLGDYTVIFAETHALPSYGNTSLPQMILARGQQMLLTTSQGTQMRILKERREGDTQVPELAEFVWSDGANQVVLTLYLTRVITNEKKGAMRMLRFLADGTLRVHLNNIDEEAHGPVMYEHPTFLKIRERQGTPRHEHNI